MRRGRVGLRDPGKPIGSFLFLGPSGVGKTELAKALAEFLFDDEHALTRLDMSEFMERHMAQRLIGAPPGYADSEQGGFLTEAVRRRPYCVLLFDEVEKAHPDVFNLLLQVLDDGRLTDGRGRIADFSNTVVIMTSNIGARPAIARRRPSAGKLCATPTGGEAASKRSTCVLRASSEALLPPRVFEPHRRHRGVRPARARSSCARIVDIQLERVGKLLEARSIELVRQRRGQGPAGRWGYEPAFGARPLERTIVRHVQRSRRRRPALGRATSGQNTSTSTSKATT